MIISKQLSQELVKKALDSTINELEKKLEGKNINHLNEESQKVYDDLKKVKNYINTA